MARIVTDAEIIGSVRNGTKSTYVDEKMILVKASSASEVIN